LLKDADETERTLGVSAALRPTNIHTDQEQFLDCRTLKLFVKDLLEDLERVVVVVSPVVE
jgi:hypothetical protein